MKATDLIQLLQEEVARSGDAEVGVLEWPSMSDIWRVGRQDDKIAISLGKKEYLDE